MNYPTELIISDYINYFFRNKKIDKSDMTYSADQFLA